MFFFPYIFFRILQMLGADEIKFLIFEAQNKFCLSAVVSLRAKEKNLAMLCFAVSGQIKFYIFFYSVYIWKTSSKQLIVTTADWLPTAKVPRVPNAFTVATTIGATVVVVVFPCTELVSYSSSSSVPQLPAPSGREASCSQSPKLCCLFLPAEMRDDGDGMLISNSRIDTHRHTHTHTHKQTELGTHTYNRTANKLWFCSDYSCVFWQIFVSAAAKYPPQSASSLMFTVRVIYIQAVKRALGPLGPFCRS